MRAARARVRPIERSRGLVPFLEGALFVHSPIAPNKLHHFYVADFAQHRPDAFYYASPDLPARRPDLRLDVVLGNEPRPGWSRDLDQGALRGSFFLGEVVFLHRASGAKRLFERAYAFARRG